MNSWTNTVCLVVVYLFGREAIAAEYPDMTGVWLGEIRTVSSGAQVQSQVAKGGAVIQTLNLRLTISYQDGEVFIGESQSDEANTEAVPIWGAIRSTGAEAVFVTGNGGRGQLWFTSPTQFEYCFANQSQEAMGAHCAVLNKD